MLVAILKGLHLLGLLLWLGGLLALSRLLTDHAREHATVRPRMSYMEGRLDRLLAAPGAILTIGSAVATHLLGQPTGFEGSRDWMIGLLLAAVAATHLFLTLRRRRFTRERADLPISGTPPLAAHLVLIALGAALLAVALAP